MDVRENTFFVLDQTRTTVIHLVENVTVHHYRETNYTLMGKSEQNESMIFFVRNGQTLICLVKKKQQIRRALWYFVHNIVYSSPISYRIRWPRAFIFYLNMCLGRPLNNNAVALYFEANIIVRNRAGVINPHPIHKSRAMFAITFKCS